MKQIFTIAVLAAGIMMLGACKEKKQSDDIITTKYVPKTPQPPIAMDNEHLSTNVAWMGKSYTVNIDRHPVDSLPKVSDEDGQKYIDNVVSVAITRQDGSTFFERTFSKRSFLSYIDSTFQRDAILAGIRMGDAHGSELDFSVVIAMPDAVDDVFIPLKLTVNSQGAISIKADNDMGMLDYGLEEEE